MAPELPSFTEDQWLASADPTEMLTVIYPKSTERQMRLFTAACCRRVWKWMPAVSREAVEWMEPAADNLGDFLKFRAGFPPAAVNVEYPAINTVSEWYSARSVVGLAGLWSLDDLVLAVTASTAAAMALEGLRWANDPTWEQLLRTAWINSGRPSEAWRRDSLEPTGLIGPVELSQFPGWATERREQAALLRHIVGNPFRPYPVPAFWPSTVVELAQAVYDGHGDHRVLSDAVEEVGHQELAEHFRGEEWHPKGCWGLDLILGRGR